MDSTSEVSQSGDVSLSNSTGDAVVTWTQTGPPDIEPGEIQYLEKIGGGCFGNVFRGICRGKEVAVKKLFKQDLDAKSLADFKKEVEIMAQLRHPNVLLFMGACTTPGHMAIVTELLKGGNGEEIIKDKNVALSLFQGMTIARDVAQGLNWIHKSVPQIIHRDLKPSNLLLDENLHAKVCDFGLSTVKVDETSKLQDKDSVPGTPLWMAPEVLMGKPFDASSDVYSYGVVLWEIVTRDEVYPEFTSFGGFKRAICYKHHRPPIPDGTPPALKELMEKCWHRDPAQRPDFEQVIAALDDIVVDVAIKDSFGNKMWKAELKSKTVTSWDSFKAALCKFMQFPYPELSVDVEDQLRYLQHILGHRKKNASMESPPTLVSIEAFGRLLQWFGPMRSDALVLQDIRSTMQQEWFHGDVSSSDAEKRLSGRKRGTFLVRLSATRPGLFTISKVAQKGINHQRITYKVGSGFSVKVASKTKKSKTIRADTNLEEFIKKYVSNELGLKTACPGSPFGFLYGNTPKHDKGSSVRGYVVVSDSDSE